MKKKEYQVRDLGKEVGMIVEMYCRDGKLWVIDDKNHKYIVPMDIKEPIIRADLRIVE